MIVTGLTGSIDWHRLTGPSALSPVRPAPKHTLKMAAMPSGLRCCWAPWGGDARRAHGQRRSVGVYTSAVAWLPETDTELYLTRPFADEPLMPMANTFAAAFMVNAAVGTRAPLSSTLTLSWNDL